MKKPLLALLFFLLAGPALPAAARAQTAADSAAIRRAALDYIEGWYAGDAARMQRALHPELAKRRVVRDARGEQWLSGATADAMVHATRLGEGTDVPPAQRRAEVRILDVYNEMATVRVTSTRVVDYLHLAKWNGEWKIVNVLWDMLAPPSR
jgi:hypothetical protein